MVSVLRPGQRHINIPAIGVRTSRRAVASAAAWWLAGGAPAPIAVYQPKGAASLAASYVNLVTPGTYDAAPGSAPTFDTTTGWKGNGFSTHLKTGVVPTAGTWSILARCSGMIADSTYMIGSGPASATAYYGIRPNNNAETFYLWGATSKSPAPQTTSGVLALAGNQPYKDGAANGLPVTGAWTGPGLEIWILTFNNNGVPFATTNGYIQAVAIWNTSTNHATWMPAVMAAAALI